MDTVFLKSKYCLYVLYIQVSSIPVAILTTVVHELQKRCIVSDVGGLIHLTHDQVCVLFRITIPAKMTSIFCKIQHLQSCSLLHINTVYDL